MPESNGFIDLRLGHGASGVGDESVWPSFTDIMTVIVMIFLMALVVIMVRNFELDRELLSTISDREEAANANQSLVRQVEQLEGNLVETQSERDMLQSRLQKELQRISELTVERGKLQKDLQAITAIRQKLEQDTTRLEQEKREADAQIERLQLNEKALTEQIERLRSQFDSLQLESSERISALTDDKLLLSEKLDVVSDQLAELKVLLEQSRFESNRLDQQVAELRQTNQQVRQNYAGAREQIANLRDLIAQRERENQALQQEVDTTSSDFKSLQEEYESLDQRYRELIRPARSTAGKYVVEIRVEKTVTGFKYEIREPGDEEWREMNRSELDQVLSELKNQQQKNLYTRIIIPQDSQLSHTEAWNFTQEILNNYDYYYQ